MPATARDPGPGDDAPPLDWLFGTQWFGIKLGLDGMRRLADALDVDLARPTCIHVAGTNGKGSTCAIAESVARATGLRTGLFTSPHLVSFPERIRIDGAPADAAEIDEALVRLRDRVRGWDPHPTFFELTTALALRHFQDRNTDIVILETGMGGRLDATNVVQPAAVALTPIAMDHAQWLGDTLEAIASEKAGILKPGVPARSAPQAPAAAAVLARTAESVGAPLAFVDAPLDPSFELGLDGDHQRWNAALALAALEAAAVTVPPEAARRGLAEVRWPGRFDRRGRFLLDGAHNPAGAAALAEAWRRHFGGRPAVVVFGSVDSKDTAGMLEALDAIAERFVFTAPDSPRALDPATLATLTSRPSTIAATATEALGHPWILGSATVGDPEAPILVTGSLYLVGEVLDLLERAGDGAAAPAFQRSAQ